MKKSELVNKIEEIIEMGDMDHMVEALKTLAVDCAPKSVASDGTKLVHYVTVCELVEEPNVKYPSQMVKCHEILAEEVGIGETVELKRVKEIFADKADELNTRQDPERIYNFYQKRMEDAQWIERTKKREEVA